MKLKHANSISCLFDDIFLRDVKDMQLAVASAHQHHKLSYVRLVAAFPPN